MEKIYKNKAIDTGAENPDLATVYNNIALAYDKENLFDSAVEFYKKSIDIGNKAYGGVHPLLATCYNNLGVMFYKTKLTKAPELCNEICIFV